jgi:hypothetical protein
VVFASDASTSGFAYGLESGPVELLARLPTSMQPGAVRSGVWSASNGDVVRQQHSSQIQWGEFFCPLAAVVEFGSLLTNSHVVFVIDNESDVHVVNRQRSREPRVATLLRCLCDTALEHNFSFRAVHRAGDSNVLMDWASRPEYHKFAAAPTSSLSCPVVGVGLGVGGGERVFPPTCSLIHNTHQQPLSEVREHGRLGELGERLRWMVQLCRTMHIADSSQKTYKGHHKIFLNFCEDFNLDPWLVDEEELALVVTHFALGHTVNSVPSFLSAVQNLFTSAGAGPLPRGPKFVQFMRGLNRLLGPADEVVRARALGWEELELILASLERTDPEEVAFGAQLVVAFSLCLRTEDHTDGRLRWGDLFPQEDGSVEFLLPPGKSVRRFRRVAIGARVGLTNAMSWLAWLAECLPEHAKQSGCPVFVSFSPGKGGVQHFPPLSRSKFIAKFKLSVQRVLGYSPALFSGYSLRRGGVTELLLSGVPPPLVKAHVGWAPDSDAIYAYYDHSGKLQMRMPSLAMGGRFVGGAGRAALRPPAARA